MMSSIEAPSMSHLWGIVTSPKMTSAEVTGTEVTGNDVTGTEREIISRAFYPYFQRFFRNSSRF